jgi:putative membrane protein
LVAAFRSREEVEVSGFGFAGGFGILALVWILVILAFWGLVIGGLILGIRWLIRSDRDRRVPPAPPPTAAADPLEVLRHRYARGEIDDQEFERRRKTLSGE